MSANRTTAALAAAGWLVICPAITKAQPMGHYFPGSLTIGPGGLTSFNWQINDAGPSTSFPNAPGVAGPSPDANNQVSGWDLLSAPKLRPTDTGNFTWLATSAAGQQFNFSLQTLLGPRTTVGADVNGPMSDFDRNIKYSWKVFDWTGTYTGPTDDATLTAATVFDFSNFNSTTAPGMTFYFHLDGANKQIDLVYGTPVPEPATLALTALGLLPAWRYRQRPTGTP